MDISYISATQWKNFEEAYPSAATFLRGAQAWSEMKHLQTVEEKGDRPLTEYERGRLNDLERWDRDTKSLRPCGQ